MRRSRTTYAASRLPQYSNSTRMVWCSRAARPWARMKDEGSSAHTAPALRPSQARWKPAAAATQQAEAARIEATTDGRTSRSCPVKPAAATARLRVRAHGQKWKVLVDGVCVCVWGGGGWEVLPLDCLQREMVVTERWQGLRGGRRHVC
jgi:hypothetical protein